MSSLTRARWATPPTSVTSVWSPAIRSSSAPVVPTTAADDQRRRDPSSAGYGHGCARRSQEDQLGGHIRLAPAVVKCHRSTGRSTVHQEVAYFDELVASGARGWHRIAVAADG